MTAVADELRRLGYKGLFLRLEPEDARVWDDGRAADELRALAADEAGDPELRFLAAEVLFRHDLDFVAPASLAPVYAQRLREAQTGNAWGLPGGPAGETTHNARRLGDAAVRAFAPLLVDGRELFYAGSETATEAERMGVRVKDVAAALLAPLLGAEFEAALEPTARDAAIDAMRTRSSS